MEAKNNYTEMGLRAMKRAALKAHEEARKNNLKVPQSTSWRKASTPYVLPKKSMKYLTGLVLSYSS